MLYHFIIICVVQNRLLGGAARTAEQGCSTSQNTCAECTHLIVKRRHTAGGRSGAHHHLKENINESDPPTGATCTGAWEFDLELSRSRTPTKKMTLAKEHCQWRWHTSQQHSCCCWCTLSNFLSQKYWFHAMTQRLKVKRFAYYFKLNNFQKSLKK